MTDSGVVPTLMVFMLLSAMTVVVIPAMASRLESPLHFRTR